MKKTNISKIFYSISTILVAFVLGTGIVAAQYTSPNYKIEETFVGPGGQEDASSASYRARNSVGDLGVGNISSASYQAYGGFTTTDAELLEIIVAGGVFDLGTLSTAQAAAVSTTFQIRSYLSKGYQVTIGGTALKENSGGHALNSMTVAAASSPGTEQFGVNLAANNLAVIGAFGAVPSQVPDSSFGFGVVDTGYNTANQFKFNAGDIVAHSNSSSGVTLFTLSMMANVSTSTPGGTYGTSLFVIVTPTF